jgi:hypothetical protein
MNDELPVDDKFIDELEDDVTVKAVEAGDIFKKTVRIDFWSDIVCADISKKMLNNGWVANEIQTRGDDGLQVYYDRLSQMEDSQ